MFVIARCHLTKQRLREYIARIIKRKEYCESYQTLSQRILLILF